MDKQLESWIHEVIGRLYLQCQVELHKIQAELDKTREERDQLLAIVKNKPS